MKHDILHAAIAAALVTGLALAGCSKHDADDTDAMGTTAAPTTSEPAAPAMPPAGTYPGTTSPAAGVTVTTVDLGNSVGADNRVTAPATSFTTSDPIHASVATDGAGGNLTAKWTFQDGQVIDTQDKAVPAGAQVTDFSISKPGGWPAGHYKLEISDNGMVVQTREFDIR